MALPPKFDWQRQAAGQPTALLCDGGERQPNSCVYLVRRQARRRITTHLRRRICLTVLTAILSPVATMGCSLRALFRRRKKAAGDDLPQPRRCRDRDHVAAQALVSSDHLPITAADSTPPTSRPHRPPPEQPQANRLESPPPAAASAASTKLTAPATASLATGDPAPSAKRPHRLWDQAYDALKRSEPALVAAYEKILSCQLQNGLSSREPET